MKLNAYFILYMLMVTWSVPVAACDVKSAPTANGRSQWFCNNSSSTVVVFVHGLNSNSVDAWLHLGEDKGNRAYWPELLDTDPLIRASDNATVPPSVLLASFHTGPGSRSFRIADAQKQIHDALFTPIDGQPPAIEKRTLILVGHSLGGVLLRDLLSRHADRFTGKRVGLLLIASPSKGSTFANVARYAQWAIDNKMVNELEQGSAYLNEVHERFKKSIASEGPLRFLVGRERYEHLGLLEARSRCESNRLSFGGVLCAAGQRIASYLEGGPVVPRDSAVVYWPETARLVPQSDHSSIAHPTDTGHPTHHALRELIDATKQAAVSACAPPADFGLTFKIGAKSSNCSDPSVGAGTEFEFLQLGIDDGAPLRPGMALTFDPLTSAYRMRLAEPPFPCTNELFWGKLLPRVLTSRRIAPDVCATNVCFRRSRQAAGTPFAVFNCVAGDECLIPEARPGIADVCREQDRTPIMVSAKPSAKQEAQWASPSLETLESVPAIERPGYSEFHIISEPLTHVAGATSFGYGVYVNGNVVRFDGREPFLEKRRIALGSRVHLTFPIENLGFRGGAKGDGYEEIKVVLRFYRQEVPIASATLQRRYVAYRHGPVIREADAETGETFSWRAIYRPATSGQNFEVMLEHGAETEWMTRRRAALDQLGKSIDGQPVVGVLRPGRRENNRIGMIIGLVQQTGQVRSLFTRQDAETLCRWVGDQSDFGSLQKKFSYLFEFPPETFDDAQDRGRRVAYCSEIP